MIILEETHAKFGGQWDKMSEFIERWDPGPCKSRWFSVKSKKRQRLSEIGAGTGPACVYVFTGRQQLTAARVLSSQDLSL